MSADADSLTVLVVEDDRELRTFLVEQLQGAGHDVTAVDTGPEAVAAVQRVDPDVMLLDLDLPGLDGLSVLRQVRPVSGLGIIIVSGRRTEADRVMGLDLGADDYLVKPFSVSELTARIRAVTRRRAPAVGHAEPARIEFGTCVIDADRRELTVDGAPVAMTRREFDLLLFLVRHPSRVFSREELLAAVWGSSADWQQVATVTEHVRRIRAKIQDDPASPQHITAVRSVGYSFSP